MWVLYFHWIASFGALLMMSGALLLGGLYLIQEWQLKTKQVGRYFWVLPSMMTTEQGTLRWLQIGFLFLTFTILSGVWLSWIPSKGGSVRYTHVGLALLSWILYFWLLPRRFGSRGRQVLVAALLGFTVVLLTFLQGRGV